jgi:hypothetical protein
MGHLTALGGSVEDALDRALEALASLRWADDTTDDADEEAT